MSTADSFFQLFYYFRERPKLHYGYVKQSFWKSNYQILYGEFRLLYDVILNIPFPKWFQNLTGDKTSIIVKKFNLFILTGYSDTYS